MESLWKYNLFDEDILTVQILEFLFNILHHRKKKTFFYLSLKAVYY